MAYRVIYGEDESTSKNDNGHSFLRIRILTAGFLLAFSLLVKVFWPAGTAALRTILLPESPSYTQIALDDCVTNIQNGESITQALTVFCRQILQYE